MMKKSTSSAFNIHSKITKKDFLGFRKKKGSFHQKKLVSTKKKGGLSAVKSEKFIANKRAKRNVNRAREISKLQKANSSTKESSKRYPERTNTQVGRIDYFQKSLSPDKTEFFRTGAKMEIIKNYIGKSKKNDP